MRADFIYFSRLFDRFPRRPKVISIYIIMTAAELVPCLVRFWRTLASEERGPQAVSRGAHLPLGRSSHERPDRWIRPSKSVIVSVWYDEVSKSNLFPTGKAFRYPRLDEVLVEEKWDSVMTLAGFEAHIASGLAYKSRSL